MERLVEIVEKAAASGDYNDRTKAERIIRRTHWAMEEETTPNPVTCMVESMITVAKRGSADRAFVSTLARGMGIYVAAQFGEESLRKAQIDYGSGTTDIKAIRRFGSLIRWAMAKPGDVGAIASITIDSIYAQLESRR